MATLPTTEASPYIAAAAKRSFARSAKRSMRSFDQEILGEQYFLYLLRLERKRSERSREPFMLMLLATEGMRQGLVVGDIAGVLGQSIRETDTLGWYQHKAKLAVIFRDFGPREIGNADLIVSKIKTALKSTLSRDEFEAIDLTFRIFPSDAESHEADLTMYPDVSGRHAERLGGSLAKRSLDLFGSAFGLLVLSPVFLALAVLVRLSSPGPILFRQKRIGQHGRNFTFLKFRSMYVNNDSTIHQEYVSKLISGHGDLKQPGNNGGVFKITNDPRVTPLGRFLRKTSLDELPQLVNVLMGQMSLVGPRPPVPYEFERYDIWHKRRVLEVKPGITGLWQIHGRSRTTFDEMVRLDLKYAKTRSMWLDIKILMRTPFVVVSGDGAY